jgi:hypothetical protein
MAATREDIDSWIETAKEMEARYIISVCDTFDYDDYPVYVMPGESLELKKQKYDRVNMQKINEVILLEKKGEKWVVTENWNG